MSFFLFRDYYLVAIMLYREYPEKSFKSFSLLANALPVGIPAEGLHLKMLQPEEKSFSRTLLGYAYSAQIGSPMLQKSYIQALVTVSHP